jgi:uncharacterized protein (TIGR02284 family)
MRNMDKDKTIEVLNDLIEACRDSQYGFKEAADNVKSENLKAFFHEISNERAVYVVSLQRQVASLGGDPERKGSAAGAMRRFWMNLKGTFSGMDEHVILGEAEKGEDYLTKAYRDALQKLSPADRIEVEQQYQAVTLVHDKVRRLRDARSATVGRR